MKGCISVVFLSFIALSSAGNDTLTTVDSSVIRKGNFADPFRFYKWEKAFDSVFSELPSFRGGLLSGFPVSPYQTSVHPLLTPGAGLFSSLANKFRPAPDFVPVLMDSRVPFTLLHGEFSTSNAQGLKVMHSRNIGKRSNITAGLHRFNGEGHFQRQNFSLEKYFITSWFLSRKNRYGLIFSGEYDALKRDENGGIEDDSLLADPTFANVKLIPVNLASASSKTASRKVTLSQYFFTGKRSDSLGLRSGRRGAIFLETSVNDGWFVYRDADPAGGFYPSVYLDSNETYDSSWCLRGQGKLGYSHREGNQTITAGWKTDYQEFWQPRNRKDYLDHWIFLTGRITDNEGNDAVKMEAALNVGGDRENVSYYVFEVNDLFGAFDLRAGKQWKVSAGMFESRNYPGWLLSSYRSNHFQWNMDLPPDTAFRIRLGAEWKKYRWLIEANYENHKGTFILWQADAPALIRDATSWTEFRMRKEIAFAGFVISADARYFMKGSELARLPDWLVKGSLSWQYTSKSKRIWTRIGTDLTWFSSWKPGIFIPALQMYALDDARETGNYLFPDFHISLRVNRVLIYFRLDHFTSGFTGPNYLMAPGYPADPRTGRLGVVWKFYD